MKYTCIVPVMTAAVFAAPSLAQVSVQGWTSSLHSTAFCGNGPAIVTYDQTVGGSGGVGAIISNHDHLTLLDDAVWGSSSAQTYMLLTGNVVTNANDGLFVTASLDPNSSVCNILRASEFDTFPIAQGATDGVFEFVFSVLTPASWSLSMNATRNPVADFAVAIYDNNTNAGVYASPLTVPVSDDASGVLPAGQYRLRLRQTSFFDGQGSDSSVASVTLTVGTIPAPSAAGLLVLGGFACVRRRRM